jgi:hypothetical protein
LRRRDERSRIRRVRTIAFVAAAAAGLAIGACGARSTRPVDESSGGGAVGRQDAGADSPPDALPDALPDVTIPSDCADAGITFVYLVSSSNTLYAFYPPDLSVSARGVISCNPKNQASPFSMAVDRVGFAYVVFTDGNLYKVNLLDASCEPTPFVPGQLGFTTFGMGFSRIADGGVDTLYVSQIDDTQTAVPSKGLASIDVGSFALMPIGPYQDTSSPIYAMELTGTGDGRLFGYALNQGPGGRVIGIDTTDAVVISETPLAAGDQSSALAFAFWGGDFYVFTSPGGAGATTITRYRPADGTEVPVGTIGDVIVGAGVSTCAPE